MAQAANLHSRDMDGMDTQLRFIGTSRCPSVPTGLSSQALAEGRAVMLEVPMKLA